MTRLPNRWFIIAALMVVMVLPSVTLGQFSVPPSNPYAGSQPRAATPSPTPERRASPPARATAPTPSRRTATPRKTALRPGAILATINGLAERQQATIRRAKLDLELIKTCRDHVDRLKWSNCFSVDTSKLEGSIARVISPNVPEGSPAKDRAWRNLTSVRKKKILPEMRRRSLRATNNALDPAAKIWTSSAKLKPLVLRSKKLSGGSTAAQLNAALAADNLRKIRVMATALGKQHPPISKRANLIVSEFGALCSPDAEWPKYPQLCAMMADQRKSPLLRMRRGMIRSLPLKVEKGQTDQGKARQFANRRIPYETYQLVIKWQRSFFNSPKRLKAVYKDPATVRNVQKGWRMVERNALTSPACVKMKKLSSGSMPRLTTCMKNQARQFGIGYGRIIPESPDNNSSGSIVAGIPVKDTIVSGILLLVIIASGMIAINVKRRYDKISK